MREQSEQRLEEMLRTGAGRARRDPSPGLRWKVRAAIDALRSEVDREPVAGPFAGFTSRERRRVVSVAAAMLVAVGLGVFGYLRSLREDLHRSVPSDRTASSPMESARKGGITAVRDPASPEAFARLALAGRRTLRTAVDDPLLTELEGIAEDATRTVRFLAGRVPASLVARENGDPGR